MRISDNFQSKRVRIAPQNLRWVKEIKHHLSRGRGVASISEWLNLPVSVINQIIKKHGLSATEKDNKKKSKINVAKGETTE